MKYSIDYQYLSKRAARPSDDGEVVGIQVDDTSGPVLLPNVGDYVHIDNSVDKGERSAFSGKVRSKLFNYIRISHDEVFCAVNIVVEETDDDWGKLIKE
ncbi:MAG: hypothetical protein KJ856_06650 [Gammaproteobacteria bacterium]|nr:hypothetical protein [Gammaproteobacteria bacterium]MBU1477981.1 hypothetical protein [Gammaproteobacteria bacterium]MBU2000879.1 hypothetical protein [Gammaproteobacteria bacterium]MBU2132952.1 hypothetical protein [Gammaproteobacteria bacterium]MBU2186694.1 hypothetical protein [Gammaproteobacteria bacterium]